MSKNLFFLKSITLKRQLAVKRTYQTHITPSMPLESWTYSLARIFVVSPEKWRPVITLIPPETKITAREKMPKRYTAK